VLLLACAVCFFFDLLELPVDASVCARAMALTRMRAPKTDKIFFTAEFIPRVSFTRKFRVAGGWMHPEQFREVRPEWSKYTLIVAISRS